jgi:hypothetical protein
MHGFGIQKLLDPSVRACVCVVGFIPNPYLTADTAAVRHLGLTVSGGLPRQPPKTGTADSKYATSLTLTADCSAQRF